MVSAAGTLVRVIESAVALHPWGEDDLALLHRANAPEMTRYLGGPESDDDLAQRHARYLRLNRQGVAAMYRIEVDGTPAGGIGYWQIEHDGEPAYETGWNVLPEFQGRGVARDALRLLLRLVADDAAPRDRLFAYPHPDNGSSNALCRAAGFEDLGLSSFPWRGATLDVRVWALDMRPLARHEPEVDEDFGGGTLDTARWWPHYLPHWSSRSRTAARYEVSDRGLTLRIDADTEPWAPAVDGDVRVAHLQTGQFSGPLGSEIGQHRFRAGLVVREEQPVHRGWLVRHGVISARFRAIRHPTAMVAFWPVGFEEQPDDCGEICIAEIFGSEIDGDGGWVGVGVKAQNDPRLRTDFEKVRVDGDLTAPHEYAVEWTPERLRFFVDGRWVKTVAQRIDYAVQLMLDLYELPGDAPRDVSQHPLLFRVERVAAWSL
jgi:RimJ/RimL family protein N-acetyltransferase